ncbi:hypothetical protein Bca4012_093139 [Brassica carinata]
MTYYQQWKWKLWKEQSQSLRSEIEKKVETTNTKDTEAKLRVKNWCEQWRKAAETAVSHYLLLLVGDIVMTAV